MRVRRNRFQCAAHAFSATIAAPARTEPPGVSATTEEPPPNRVTGELLVDPHAAVEEHAADAAGEASGLHRRAVARGDAAVEHGRVDLPPELLGGEHLEGVGDAQPVGCDHEVSPLADLSGGGRHAELAVRPEPRVDIVARAARADLAARSLRPRRRARAPRGRRTSA